MTRQQVRAGRVDATLDDGALRWIRLDDVEVLRGLYVAVRDDAWLTAPAEVDMLRVEQDGTSFRVLMTSTGRLADLAFSWTTTITGDASGTVRFAMDGQALSTFWSNRIGICILHPLEVAGRPVVAQTIDGHQSVSVFPEAVDPGVPFTDLIGMEWWPADGVHAALEFEGDAFEMEDQRNWTDASFKTFSRPLRLPKPVLFEKGDRVRQEVRLSMGTDTKQEPATVPVSSRQVVIAATCSRRLPRLGMGLRAGGETVTPEECSRLKVLGPSILRAVVEADRPGWESALDSAVTTAREVRAALEVEIVVDEAAAAQALDDVMAQVSAASPAPWGPWGVFDVRTNTTTVSLATILREAAARHTVPCRQFGGSRTHLAELNRANLPLTLLDTVTFPVSPQVHASDDDTVMENVHALRPALARARAIADGRPLTAGPVLLRSRFNAYGAGRPRLSGAAEDEARADPRQWTDFGAAWTVACLAVLAMENVETVIIHEATGPAGVLGAAPGQPESPVYRVLALVGEMCGRPLWDVAAPPGIEVLAADVRGSTHVLIANTTHDPQTLQVLVESDGHHSTCSLPPHGWTHLEIPIPPLT